MCVAVGLLYSSVMIMPSWIFTLVSKKGKGKDRNELLQPKENTSNNANQRIPLMINWHRKFKGISKLLHDNYRHMINEHPEIKNVFPEHPIVSFRKNATLESILIKSEEKSRQGGYSVRCTKKNTKSGAGRVNYAATWDKSTNC